MTAPNMTPAQLRAWQKTDAFTEYRSDRGANTVDAVVRRTMRVLKGSGSDAERQKVEGFIARMKANEAGAQEYGSGSSAVSARTASLRNWGYDPTGRFS